MSVVFVLSKKKKKKEVICTSQHSFNAIFSIGNRTTKKRSTETFPGRSRHKCFILKNLIGKIKFRYTECR